ncbi:MAG: ABC transporter substrate-binding protein [Bacteriovoracales bacterium]|nr:ABC transporter substrate-binding protein [Bacteriovoracales bacterium]
MSFLRSFIMPVLVFAGLFGCFPQKKETTKNEETTETRNAPVAEEIDAGAGDILVGSVFPLTGPIATYGQESLNGIKLALETINAEGINGKKMRLISEDNKGEPTESANAVRKLINVDKVHVIFGSVASSNTLAGAPIAQAAKVPLLTPASTNEVVTKKGDYIFRSCFTDDFQGVVMAKFARETLKKNKALIVIDVASDYSRGLAKVFQKNFVELGGQVIEGTFTYNQGDKDFRSLLRKVKRAAPDVIFVPGYYTEVGTMLQQARQMGFSVPFLGGDGWDSPKLKELAGSEGIKGNYISSHFSPDDQDPAVQTFVKNYKAKYAQLPGAMAALGHDGMLVLAHAIRSIKTEITHEAVREALSKVRGFMGVTGTITIDENRNAKKSAVVLETTPNGTTFKQKVSP